MAHHHDKPEWSETEDATEETQRICDELRFDLPLFFTTSTHNSLVCISVWIYIIFYSIHTQVKGQVEKQTGENYREFKAVKYRENVGKELFLIKVHVGGTDYIHLRVVQFIWLLRSAPQEVDILSGVEQHKTKDDPLVPFTN
ncbi:hypothetical protein ABVT39_013242 [Epinephelus coioides]